MVAFLEVPRVPMKTRSKKGITKKELFMQIENFHLDYLTNEVAKIVFASTRIIKLNKYNNGQPEFVLY